MRFVLNLAPPAAVGAATLRSADPLVVNEHEARAVGIGTDAAGTSLDAWRDARGIRRRPHRPLGRRDARVGGRGRGLRRRHVDGRARRASTRWTRRARATASPAPSPRSSPRGGRSTRPCGSPSRRARSRCRPAARSTPTRRATRCCAAAGLDDGIGDRMSVPVIVDCDPGHDDVFALWLAAGHPSLELVAVTTVGGNVPLEHTSRNARIALTVAGVTGVPVAAGAAGPLARALETAEWIHGENGLGGPELPEPDGAARSARRHRAHGRHAARLRRAGRDHRDRADHERRDPAARPPRRRRPHPRDRAGWAARPSAAT